MDKKHSVKYTKIHIEHEAFLKEMLFMALYIPPGEPKLPKSVVEHPDLKKYYSHWGRVGDIGILARVNEAPIAACWSRLFPAENPGYGFVSSDVPELTIAVKKEWRNQGLGKEMLALLFEANKVDGFKSVSLSVDQRNKAQELYKRLGFKVLEEKGTSYLMLKSL